jgi:hypothetical protein
MLLRDPTGSEYSHLSKTKYVGQQDRQNREAHTLWPEPGEALAVLVEPSGAQQSVHHVVQAAAVQLSGRVLKKDLLA